MPSKDSQEYILAWVGSALGLLSLVLAVIPLLHPEGFPVSPTLLLYLSGTALIAGTVFTGGWRWLRNIINRPDIETDSVVIALTLNDKHGKSATLDRTQIDHANRKVLSHTFTVGGIAATGSIAQLSMDGKVVPQSDWESQINGCRVTRTRQVVLDARSPITRTFQLDLVNSFEKNVESLVHEISGNENALALKVKFPSDRSCKKISAFMAFGNVTREALPQPLLDADGYYTISIKRPQLGGTYRIEWEW